MSQTNKNKLSEEIYKLSLQNSEVAMDVFNHRKESNLTDKEVMIFCEVTKNIGQNIKILEELLK